MILFIMMTTMMMTMMTMTMMMMMIMTINDDDDDKVDLCDKGSLIGVGKHHDSLGYSGKLCKHFDHFSS